MHLWDVVRPLLLYNSPSLVERLSQSQRKHSYAAGVSIATLNLFVLSVSNLRANEYWGAIRVPLEE